MKFYKLNYSISIKEIGYFPQAPNVKLLSYNTSNLGKRPIRTQLIPPEPILKDKAKATSLLSTPSISFANFLVLEKQIVDTIIEYNIGEYNTWKMKVHHKKKILENYRLFHLSYSHDDKCVDFKESNFLIGKLGDWKDPSIRKQVKVMSPDNYMNLLEILSHTDNNSQIRCDKLTLDFRNTKEDLIRFSDIPLGLGYYVSERLKNAIEEKHFTGMTFQEIEQMDNKIKAIY
jgi:hypothetical protein